MGPPRHSKWFHAIVVMGTSLTGCGGRIAQDDATSDAGIDLASSAILEERRHAALCRDVAAGYGATFGAPAEPASTASDATAGTPALEVTLHVVALSCIQETIACAWLHECFEHATAPAARAALRQLLADETQHARLGWAHLASPCIGAAERVEIAARLPALLDECARPWRAKDASGLDDGIVAHGIPADARTQHVVSSALRDVVLPGFATVGLALRAS